MTDSFPVHKMRTGVLYPKDDFLASEPKASLRVTKGLPVGVLVSPSETMRAPGLGDEAKSSPTATKAEFRDSSWAAIVNVERTRAKILNVSCMVGVGVVKGEEQKIIP